MSNNGHDGKAEFSAWLSETKLPGGADPQFAPDRPAVAEESSKLVVAFDGKSSFILPGKNIKHRPFGDIYEDGVIGSYNDELNMAVDAGRVVIKDGVAWLTHKGMKEMFGVAGEVSPPSVVEAPKRRAVPTVELRSGKTIDELIKPFEKILQQAGLALRVKVERGNKQHTHKLILKEGGGGEAVFKIDIEYPKRGLKELQAYLASHHDVEIEL